jgi:hypothetical protein
MKCLQQLQIEQRIRLSEILRRIIKANGYFGLYRGFWATFNRDVVATGLCFYVYNTLKDHYQAKDLFDHHTNLLIGGVSGIIAWLSTYPFDTIKTIIQTTHIEQKASSQYELIMANKFSLFRGIGVCGLLAFSVNAAAFFGEEIAHKYLDKYLI